jgi:hypothetical protein
MLVAFLLLVIFFLYLANLAQRMTVYNQAFVAAVQEAKEPSV